MDDTTNQGGHLRWLQNASSRATIDMQTNGVLNLSIFNASGTYLGLGWQVSPTGPTFGSPITYANTNAAAANVVIDSNGWLYRSTSSRRYKDDIQPYEPPEGALDGLHPVSYVPKDPTIDQEGRRYAGFIAEDVDALGLKEFVGYDPEGRPDELYYAHMAALLVAELQAVRRRLASVEARLIQLEH
jgi:hypothetical protein